MPDQPEHSTTPQPPSDEEKASHGQPDAFRKTATRSSGKFTAGTDGRCHHVDEWWTQVTGMDPEDALGGGWLRTLYPDDHETVREKFEENIREQKEFQLECRLVDDAGTVTDVLFRIGPVFDEANVLTGYEGTVSDRAANRDTETGEAKTSQFEALSVLVGGIAHDFNNLITPILLNLSLAQSQIRMPQSTEDVEQRLRECEQAALRAKTLTERLLACARGGNPVKKTVHLQQLIEESVQHATRGENIQADISLAEDLWPVSLDSTQFNEAIQSLVLNACEAMPSGGTVHVSATNLEKIDRNLKNATGPHVLIRVEDEGPGVRFDVLDRIFDPYFSTKKDGTGLGLPTALAIARNHSGHLLVDSEAGHGTTVSIYLPAAETEPAETEKTSPRVSSSDDSRTKVLFMDDEDLMRSSVKGILNAYGYDVETARDGQEALNIYSQAKSQGDPIDLTLMDLTIHGGMGGKEAICRLKSLDPEAVAVVCSGYSNDPIMINFQNYGFSGAIKKPFHPDDLNRLIQSLVIA